MDGYCKESSRWVSLLVAEVYYPNAKFSQVRPPVTSGSRMPSGVHKQFMSPLNPTLSPLSTAFASGSPTSQALHQALQHQPSSNLQALNSATSLVSLPSFGASNQPMKYGYPSLSNSLSNDYNHYENLFSRRASVPSASPVKQPKFVAPLRPKLANVAAGPTTSGWSSSYSPQQLQQMWQQYQQALGMYQPLKPAVRSSSVSPTGQYANRWFNGAATARSSDARPRSFQGDHRPVATDSNLSNGATYVDDEESVTVASKSNELRTASSSPATAAEPSVTNSAAEPQSESHGSNTSASTSAVQPPTEHNEEECDGYDSNGCYVIRVYYDWFLVPGSCKCWKRSTTGSFDTLKRIFIG
jgi:hypothetical protein